MPPDPISPVDRFTRAIVRSALVERSRFQTILNELPADVRTDAARLAQHFVETDLLTQYQAGKLLQGAWQGLVLGTYQVLAPLGKGGMGIVYLARDTRGPKLAALKVLSSKRAREEERTLARFLREMSLASKVSHPHLTQTFETGEIQGVYYIAMEYIRGISLTRLINDQGTLLVPRAARIFAEIASALEHSHQLGLIHRDLKPSNIMITPNGHAKVLDLGLAMMEDEVFTDDDKTIIGGVGYIVGTMDYIAPEQAEDSTNVSARSDLYAFGCTMYFALTGRPPFPGGTSLEKMLHHRDSYPEPITELNPTVPVEFALIVERLMAKKPERRFPNATSVREALLPWTRGDVERPMDVINDGDETQMVHEIEADHAKEATVWESIPVIAYGEPKVRVEMVGDALSDSEVVRVRGVSVLVLASGTVGLFVLMLMLEFFRRV